MDLTWLSAIVVGAGCLVLGYYIGSKYPPRIFFKAKLAKSNESSRSGKKDKPKEALEIESLADILDDFKMVCFCVSLSLSIHLKIWLTFTMTSRWSVSLSKKLNNILLYLCRFWLWEMIWKWAKEKLLPSAGIFYQLVIALSLFDVLNANNHENFKFPCCFPSVEIRSLFLLKTNRNNWAYSVL